MVVDAKRKAESDAKIRSEKRKLSEAKKREKAEAAVQMNLGWEKQRASLIDASVEGLQSFILKPPIYRYRNLLLLDFLFSEEGWVMNQDLHWDRFKFELIYKTESEEVLIDYHDNPRFSRLKRIRMRLNHLVERFSLISFDDVQRYYGFPEFSRILKRELLTAIDSSSSLFDVNYVMWVNVSESKKRKYAEYFLMLHELINEHKTLKEKLSKGLAPPKFKDGIYYFHLQDRQSDVIHGPTLQRNNKGKENTFNVYWPLNPKSETLFFNGEIFSCGGLAWLSSRHGQKLLDSIFGSLEQAAKKARSKLMLRFSTNSFENNVWSDWYFEEDGIGFIPSCNPNDLIEIIERRGFTIVETQLADDICMISVSW